jgi:ribosomal protein L37E
MFGGSCGSPGMVAIGPKLHLVGGMLDNEEDPNALVIAVITQRQSIGTAQREELRFICDRCSRRLFFHKVDATPPRRGTQKATLGAHPSFLTIIETYEAARLFNADEQARKCPHCGFMNPPFPIASWGWDAYARQSEIASSGSESIAQAQSKAKDLN